MDRELADRAAVRRPSLTLLGVSAVVSIGLMLLPAFFLAWFWPGVPSGQLCDVEAQGSWCRPGYGLPQWYGVAVAGLASMCLHLAAAVRWPRPSARTLSLLGLAAAALATGLVVFEPVLSGVLPSWWFAS